MSHCEDAARRKDPASVLNGSKIGTHVAPERTSLTAWRLQGCLKTMTVTFVLLFLVPGCLATVTIPPLISQQPDKLIIFQVGIAVQLPCVATGNPPPSYKWTYNDLSYDPSATDNLVQQLPGVGTIIINEPRTSDQGYYKCRAINDFGVALANTILLLYASLDSFPKLPPNQQTVAIGGSITFVCGQPSSFPYPVIYWQKFDTQLQAYVNISYDDRVAQDPDGRLHFAYVMQSDQGDYQCNVHNTVLRRTATSRVNRIIVQGGSNTSQQPVTLRYSAPVNFVAYRGQPLKLKCVFGGMPTPVVQWFRGNGSRVSASYIAGYGLEMIIPSTSYSDAGTYECRGYNPASTNPGTATMLVTVYSTPYFVQLPLPQNRSIGESVTFICEGDGIPKPTTRWYINGNLTVASKGKIILDGINMTIVNLTREDTMAIQCNITNYSGWEATSFYINVLDESSAIQTPSPAPTLQSSPPTNGVTGYRTNESSAIQTPSPASTLQSSPPTNGVTGYRTSTRAVYFISLSAQLIALVFLIHRTRCIHL